MTDPIPADPELSPSFERARSLSRILAVIFAIAYWATWAFLITMSVVAVWPEGVQFAKKIFEDLKLETIDIPAWGRAGAAGIIVTFTVPVLIIFQNARRVFLQFAEGHVFSAITIAHMRTTALWLIIAGVVPPRPIVLIFGVATYVTVYVMAEARRIADDNASII